MINLTLNHKSCSLSDYKGIYMKKDLKDKTAYVYYICWYVDSDILYEVVFKQILA